MEAGLGLCYVSSMEYPYNVNGAHCDCVVLYKTTACAHHSVLKTWGGPNTLQEIAFYGDELFGTTNACGSYDLVRVDQTDGSTTIELDYAYFNMQKIELCDSGNIDRIDAARHRNWRDSSVHEKAVDALNYIRFFE